MSVMRSSTPLGEVIPNLGSLLLEQKRKLGDKPAFAERPNARDSYRYFSWNQLVDDSLRFASHLSKLGLIQGDKIALISGNHYRRQVAELGMIAAGFVSVPIFAGYPKEMIRDLIKFSEAKLILSDDPQLTESHISLLPGPKGIDSILSDHQPSSSSLIEKQFSLVPPSATATLLFTSGTSGRPKGVELTHENLLSQQKALRLLWRPETGMRFLCYLPWHHSFGGLFERFFVISSGGCLAIDDSMGKDVNRLLKNFSEIKPNVYFSVPKVYQEIVSKTLTSPEADRSFFHSELKFIFTAAAPLPMSISEVFKSKKIPVAEGWGLTETSPCCTLTELSLERETGLIGFPIPGVEVKLADDHEILVRGPNIMKGYFNLPDATRDSIDSEGWFKTGDLGEITPRGLRILSRKDRMFKLSNGEKVYPSTIEERIKSHCKFIRHAFVFGKGQPHLYMLVFPNRDLYPLEAKSNSDCKNCAYPKSSDSLSNCLNGCLAETNLKSEARFEKIKRAIIINESEPTVENGQLTPSFKLVPKAIESSYSAYMKAVETNYYSDLPKNYQLIDIEIKKDGMLA